MGGRVRGRHGAPSRGRGVRGPDPPALRGTRAACVRAGGPADHDARPRAARRPGRDGLGRELRGAPGGHRANRRVRRVARPRSRRRGGLAPPAARGRRLGRVPGGGRPGAPPRAGRLQPGAADPGGLPPRPRSALDRRPPRNRAGPSPRVADPGGLRMAHGPPRLPPGSDHGSARGRSRDGGAPAAMSADPGSFLSGDAGDVTGPWRRAKRTAGELAFGAIDALSAARLRTARLARTTPRRSVLVGGVYRPGSDFATALPGLQSERHDVRIALGSTADVDPSLAPHTAADHLAGGKFENLNRLVEAAAGGGAQAAEPDWLVVVGDDGGPPRAVLYRVVAGGG